MTTNSNNAGTGTGKTDPAGNQVAVIEYLQPGESLTNQIIDRIGEMVSANELLLPKNYAAEHAVRSAWLHLQNVVDKDNNPVLTHCTKHSIANAIMKMVRRGLSVDKEQGYFIAYGKTLHWQNSYLGSIAIAKRIGVINDCTAMCIYKEDVYETEVREGRKYVLRHEQPFKNIDPEKLIGAYSVIYPADKSQPYVIEMTMPQIRLAWGMGGNGGNSKAHKNFPDQMAMKTVTNRGLKPLINTTDDADLLEDDAVEDAEYQLLDQKIAQDANKELLTVGANHQPPAAQAFSTHGIEAQSAAPIPQVSQPASNNQQPPFLD